MRVNKLAVAALIALVVAGVVYLRSPLRTRIPNASSDIAAIRPQLDRLEPRERELVMGYLLRQRHETLSTSTADDAVFDATTFRDAIAAQEAFLEKEHFSTPAAFLKIGLRDQLLRPMRAAVVGELYRRDVSSARKIFSIPDGYSTRYGNDPVAEQDKPILVTIYRVRNLTGEAIAKVSGTMEIRRARYDPATTVSMFNSCFFDVESLPPHGERLVPCSNVNRMFSPEDRDFVAAAAKDMHIVWSPRSVEFANGARLKFEDSQLESSLLWDFYRID
jgi:hypothetical protein